MINVENEVYNKKLHYSEELKHVPTLFPALTHWHYLMAHTHFTHEPVFAKAQTLMTDMNQ